MKINKPDMDGSEHYTKTALYFEAQTLNFIFVEQAVMGHHENTPGFRHLPRGAFSSPFAPKYIL